MLRTSPIVPNTIQNYPRIPFVVADSNFANMDTSPTDKKITAKFKFRHFSKFLPQKSPEISSTDIFSQSAFRHKSKQGRDLKVTPQQFCIIRHIDGIVVFAAIPFWWIFGHF